MEPAVSVHYTASATNFSFGLFRELGASVDGNVFASTYSVHLLLLLLTIGSRSKTNEQLTSVLRLPKHRSPNFDKIKAVIDHIEESEYLTVANGIFADKAFDLSADYEYQVRNYLKSEVRRLDFAGSPSAGESEINEWAKNKTNGKISKVLDQGSVTRSTAMVLASAVHFQNTWKHQFAETKTAMFCLSAREHVPVQMMRQTGYFKYHADAQNKFAAVELPYQGGKFEMLVILPDKMDGVTDLENTILGDSTKFPILLANLTVHKVVLDLPKFKFESDLNLEKSMRDLGCGDIFTPAADFSKMSSSGAGKLKVDNMKHKSFVDVNELGTEAAGISVATIVTYNLEYNPPEVKTVKFHACHPFLFIIKKGSDVVFMGRMTNPNV